MGKIVKHCGSCEESFAEKFVFCPNCGSSLEAFEMNPLPPKAPVEPPIEAAAPAPAAPVEPPAPEFIAAPVTRETAAFESVAAPVTREISAPIFEAPAPLETELVAAAEPVVEPVMDPAPVEPEAVEEVAEPVVKAPATREVPAAAAIFTQTTPVDADRIPSSFEAEHEKVKSDGGFYVTVIEEKNGGQRNLLLLGAAIFMVTLAVSSTVYSLFNKSLGVYAIGDDNSLASLIDEVPAQVEEEKPVQKDKKDAGGGGGGGREEKDETTQGDLADQTKNPIRPPDAKVFRSDNFELKTPPPSTEGDKKFDKKFDQWGDPNGRFANFSNGTGSGGGQGSGTGTGQGSGRGTGAGSGNGSGSGSGLGNGNGNGTGSGTDSEGGTPPPRTAGVSQAIRIISKPRAPYTDAARQAALQGTVSLRVTFLASGQIGSVSVVRGLGNGLTESAISAAKHITFEPAKVNGVPSAVTKTVEYAFTMY